MGIFYRTIKIVENGIKPVYVFDGKPPEMKGGELAKRLAKREAAIKSAEELKETGTAEDINRFERRTVRVTKEQNDEAKRLLKLMGIPYVEAPGEAEAQCAELAKAGKVYAAASEDMDTLTFGTPILLRHLTASEQKGMSIVEVDLKKALNELELTTDSFIDLCILLGCDYCETIRGIGPATGFKLIKENQSLEKVVEKLSQGTKHRVPDDWPYEQVRKLFHEPDIQTAKDIELKWEEPDIDGLIQFLVEEKGFSEDRVRSGAQKLIKGSKVKVQGRMEDFFKMHVDIKKKDDKGKDSKGIKKQKIAAKGAKQGGKPRR